MNKSNDKWLDEDEDEELSKICVSCGFKDAYREAKGKVSPAKIMERIVAYPRAKTKTKNRERKQGTVKINCIAFWILSGVMIVYTVIVLGFWTRFIIY